MRWHGNGFVQIPLNDLTRLHIWDPRFEPYQVGNALIHDHRFTFTSRVLFGTLQNVEYQAIPIPAGLYRLWKVSHDDQGGKDTAPTPLEIVRLEEVKSEVITRGMSYTSGGPGVFHKSVPAACMVATVMTKTWVGEHYSAKIVAPVGEAPDHAYDPAKAPPDQLLQDVVSEAFSWMDGLL